MSKKNVFLGTLLGVVAGAVAGVLMAPKSGKESREFIAKKTKSCVKQCNCAMEKGVKVAKDFVNTEEDAAKKMIKDAADKVSEKMNSEKVN